MRNNVCQPIVRLLLRHHAERRSWKTRPGGVSTAVYTDPQHLSRERRTLLRAWPQMLALSVDLPRPGSYVARDELAVPVVLVRDADARVHALANVCAHRGARVGRGRGCRQRLTCPYHAWSYDLDGALVAIPDHDAFPGIPVPGPGLLRLPTVERDGLIWVIPAVDATTRAPDPALGSFGDDFSSYFRKEELARLRHWRSRRFSLEFNWKLAINTFLEPYHFAVLHRDTVAPMFLPNLCHAAREGHHVREVLPRRSILELASQPPETWDLVPHSAIVYVLFPNTVLVIQIDHVELWRVYPDAVDPGRSIVVLDFYVPDDPASERSALHWQRNWDLTLRTVIDEDFKMMAEVQHGLRSGARARFQHGANESALAMFHAALAEAMAQPEPRHHERRAGPGLAIAARGLHAANDDIATATE